MATATKTDLQDIAKLLAKLDIGMLTTKADDGTVHGRPMSNNGEVEYDGDSWFFSEDGTRKVTEIEADPAVELAFIDTKAGTWVNVEGEATILRDDVERKQELWLKDLERWFPNGPDDPNVALIRVASSAAQWWTDKGDGTANLS